MMEMLAIIILLVIIGLLGVIGIIFIKYSALKREVAIVKSFFGREFINALKIRDGILFLRIDTSGDSDFEFVPWDHKDETFYYIERKKGEGESEKLHYKVRKRDVIRLRDRLNMAIITEESVSAVSPEIMATLSDLSPREHARLLSGYIRYQGLKTEREAILQALPLERNPDARESYKQQLDKIEEEMSEIRSRWSSIVQEVDMDSILLLPDEKGKKLRILRPVRIDELSDYLASTRPDEVIYTAKKILIDWEQMVLSTLDKLITPAKKAKGGMGSRGSFTTVLLVMGGIFTALIMYGLIHH